MKQNLTLPEIQITLRMARMMPARTSPLPERLPPAAVDPAVLNALSQKGVSNGSGTLTAPWLRALSTLADPAQHEAIHIEGAGVVRYFEGAGGMATDRLQ